MGKLGKYSWWIAGAVLLGLAYTLGRPLVSFPVGLGNRKITQTNPSDDGWVWIRPAELAAKAGVSVDTYSLARIVGSEHESGTATEKAAIALVIVNVAKQRGWSLTKMATYTTKMGDQGYYGTQEHGRFAATTRDPTERDLWIAEQVVSGRIKDFTRGADKFFDPGDQDALAKKKPGIYKPAKTIIASWLGEGREVVKVPGVNQNELMLFRRV